jgi:Sulfotransferase domain
MPEWRMQAKSAIVEVRRLPGFHRSEFTMPRSRANAIETMESTEETARTRIPDFFIIGAPKCGTTALSEYLRAHPNICFSHVKEPHFFSEDFPTRKTDRTLDDYLRRNFSHFDTERHHVMGEGSVYYYLSEVAVSNVLQLNPGAKFIYAIRNPADFVYALHAQYRFSSSEDVVDFEQAWDLQEDRARGKRIPRHCYEPRFLQYRVMGKLGHRLAALKGLIPADQLLVITLDDLASDASGTYRVILDFIGVPFDGRRAFPIVNENKVQRSRMVGHLSSSVPSWLYNSVRAVKHQAGLSHISFLGTLNRINARQEKRPPLRDSFKRRLNAEFEPEVRLLEAQLGRDLTHWRI